MAQGSVFGVAVETDLNLPLNPEISDATVRIKRARVRIPTVSPNFSNQLCRIYVLSPGTITFEFSGGRLKLDSKEIVIDSNDVTDIDLLLMFVWPVMLSRLGRESLHGCVVEYGGTGIAIIGAPGAGKSTTALRLIEQGFRLVTDDLIVFDREFRVMNGPPFLRLRPDQVQGHPGRWDRSGKFRCDVPVSDSRVPLGHVIVMDGSVDQLVRITGARAVELLVRNLASGHVLFPDQGRKRFKLATSVAQEIPLVGAKPRSLQANDLAAFFAPMAHD